MANEKIIQEIAKKLGLNFTESNISLMCKLLEEGMSPDNLVKLLEDVKTEISSMH